MGIEWGSLYVTDYFFYDSDALGDMPYNADKLEDWPEELLRDFAE